MRKGKGPYVCHDCEFIMSLVANDKLWICGNCGNTEYELQLWEYTKAERLAIIKRTFTARKRQIVIPIHERTYSARIRKPTKVKVEVG